MEELEAICVRYVFQECLECRFAPGDQDLQEIGVGLKEKKNPVVESMRIKIKKEEGNSIYWFSHLSLSSCLCLCPCPLLSTSEEGPALRRPLPS